MKKEKIILIGGGGHCVSCIDVIESEDKFTIEGIIDIKSMVGKKVSGYSIIGTDDDLAELVKKYKNFIVTIGQIKNGQIRIKKFLELKKLGAKFPVIVSSRARVSRTASIEEGSIVMHDVIINSCSKIGKNCIINTKALIEHEATIGDHSHVATGTIVNGQCNVGSEVFLGSGSVIANNINVADRVIVGAGSIVIRDVSVPGTYVGAPVRKL